MSRTQCPTGARLLEIEVDGEFLRVLELSGLTSPGGAGDAEGSGALELALPAIAWVDKLLADQEANVDYVWFDPSGYGPEPAQLAELARVLCSDVFFAFAMPCIAADAQERAILHRMASEMPGDTARVFVGGPVLVRAEVLRNFGPLDVSAPDLDSALAGIYIKANRRGFSARMVHSIIVDSQDHARLHAVPRLPRASDYYKALSRQSGSPDLRLEQLLRFHLAPKSEREILFDIRNLAPGFNGSSQHMLSLLDPIVGQAPDHGFRPYFWVTRESADFHGLDARYPSMMLHELPADRLYDACVRLTQPWQFSDLQDQARRAVVNVYSVLDTIAWDCHYIRMPHLDGLWRAMAAYADGLAFISRFSQERFNRRFPAAAGALQQVASCSLDPGEYWKDIDVEGIRTAEPRGEPYILIVGNRYFHKGLPEAVAALAAAFPDRAFKVLGEGAGTFPNVQTIASGHVSRAEVAELFRACDCVVFPSHYEGFGMPVLEALAFRKAVVAREGPLLRDIVNRVAPVKGIVPFRSMGELREAVRGVLDGGAEHASGSSGAIVAPADLYRWEDSARELLGLVGRLLASGDLRRCKERLEFLYRIDQFAEDASKGGDQISNVLAFKVAQEEE